MNPFSYALNKRYDFATSCDVIAEKIFYLGKAYNYG
jgi:hypothetical protein